MGERPNWYTDEPGGDRFRFPHVRTWSGAVQLVALLAVVFFLQLIGDGVWRFLCLDIEGLANPLNWYRFVSYALVHSQDSLLHLFGNCLIIFFFGQTVEQELGGKKRFFLFCAISAALAGLCYVIWELVRSGPVPPLIGASGMAFACLVGFAVQRPNAQIIFFIVPVRAWILATAFMTIEMYAMIMGMSSGSSDGVAHVAHLAGGAFGFVVFRYRYKIEAWQSEFRERRSRDDQRKQVDKRAETDRILAKISKSGIGSLTKSERRFLESASKDYRKRD